MGNGFYILRRKEKNENRNCWLDFDMYDALHSMVLYWSLFGMGCLEIADKNRKIQND